jgi:putative transposase
MAGKNRQASRGPGSPGRGPGATAVSTASDADGFRKHRKRSKHKTKECENKSEKDEIHIEPLNAWAQLLLEQLGDPRGSGGSGAQAVQRVSVVRTDTLRLLTTPELDDFLRRVGDATARLINMENFRRRKQFFEGKGIDYSWMSAWSRRFTDYFEIYKLLGSANFHEVCRALAEQWRSFLGLLKAAREGRLPPWLKPRPPGYRKRDGQRTPIVVVRFDNYEVDLKRRVLLLKYWKLEVPFKGKPRWLTRPDAKQGRLIILYDETKKRWYARVSVEVLLKRESSGKGFIGIDLGREVIVTAVASDGMALLYKGKVLKSDYYYFEKKIAAIDSALSKLEEVDRNVLAEERRRLFEKRKRRRDQVFANTAAHLARFARERSVGVVFIGHPWGIAQDKPGKGNTNMWGYRRLMLRHATTLENHGIAAFAVREDGTSKTCAWHGCEIQRGPRGLVHCPHGHTVHSDVNAAVNILLRGLEALGIKASPPSQVRVLSFIPTPSGVRVVERKRKNKRKKPITPR